MKGYEEEYQTELHNHLYSNEQYYKIRAKLALLKYFKNVPKDAKVLEFGCGLGPHIFYLPNAIGYDISKFSLDFCKKKGIKVVTDIKKIKNNSMDVVFSCHVMEHLDNPLETIELLKSKLKKGGKLITILPTEKHKKTQFKIDANQHLFAWTFKTFNNLLIKSGFEIEENKYLRGKAYMKLLPLHKLNFGLYKGMTELTAQLLGSKEMMIVAVKN